MFTSSITMLLLGKLDMKMKFKFGIVLCMITSCHSNMRENVHADKVITLQPHAGEMQEARYELA